MKSKYQTSLRTFTTNEVSLFPDTIPKLDNINRDYQKVLYGLNRVSKPR